MIISFKMVTEATTTNPIYPKPTTPRPIILKPTSTKPTSEILTTEELPGKILKQISIISFSFFKQMRIY